MNANANQITHVRIPTDLVNATLNYLATRPYAEVFELIGALKQAGDASITEQHVTNAEEPSGRVAAFPKVES